MDISWIVTPWFFDVPDPALRDCVPASAQLVLNDPGDIADRSTASLALLHRPIAQFVAQAPHGALPVSIAGDCAASLPVMAGLQRAGLAPVLVWLDAHGDFNTAETSPSGFLGGMPLAMMVGRGDLSLPRASGATPIREEDVWLIGARDLDPLEARALDASAVNRADMSALESLRLDRPVHLHIDIDVIDAAEVPANNYPVPGGPSLAETTRACTHFAAANQLCAISVSGWNGALDRDGTTALATASLLSAIGKALS